MSSTLDTIKNKIVKYSTIVKELQEKQGGLAVETYRPEWKSLLEVITLDVLDDSILIAELKIEARGGYEDKQIDVLSAMIRSAQYAIRLLVDLERQTPQ